MPDQTKAAQHNEKGISDYFRRLATNCGEKDQPKHVHTFHSDIHHIPFYTIRSLFSATLPPSLALAHKKEIYYLY